MKKKPVIYISVLVIVLAGFFLFVAPFISVKTVNGWTCAYTGSEKGYTTWFYLLKTSEWQRVSPIEAWLSQQNRPVEHHWVRTMGTHYSLSGGVFRGHDRAPVMRYFDHRLQAIFVRAASEEEILTFLAAVKSKPRGEAKEMVDTVVYRIMEEM